MRNISREKSRIGSASGSNVEAGYTLLMVVFMVATLLLFAVAATPSVVTEGRRLKEQEDIWRGNQYVRAIRLYYQKTGRYPQTIDDLTKADAAGNHFLRKQYTDLMNSEDGKWRMIYVSASGQLIGSVRYHSLQEMALAQNGLAASFGTVAGGAGATQGMPGQGVPGQAGQTGPAGQPQTSAFGASAQPQTLAPLEPVDGPVLGGFLIGVGGKQKRPSLMVYQGGKTYYEWEFIWNPLATGGAGGAPVALPGATAPAGTAPAGAAPGTTVPGATAPGGTAPGVTAPDGTTPGTTAPAGTAPPATVPPGTPPAATNPPADPNAPASAPTP